MVLPKDPIGGGRGEVNSDPVANGEQTANTVRSACGEVTLESRAIEEPPKLYLPACGALCDILWWARSS